MCRSTEASGASVRCVVKYSKIGSFYDISLSLMVPHEQPHHGRPKWSPPRSTPPPPLRNVPYSLVKLAIHVHAALAVRGAATDSQCGMHMNHYSPPETIFYATDSLNETRVRRVLLEFLAQPAHMHINCAGVADIILAPDVLDQVITSQHSTPVAH